MHTPGDDLASMHIWMALIGPSEFQKLIIVKKRTWECGRGYCRSWRGEDGYEPSALYTGIKLAKNEISQASFS